MMKELEKRTGYKFKNPNLLEAALTHSSYANELRGRGAVYSNERLEFLGDSVLSLIAAEYLYTRYTGLPEGDLTKVRASVVCEGALHGIALELGIGALLRLGRGEESNGGRERVSILADAVEAVLGAIYVDGGLEPARDFMLRFLPDMAETAVKGRLFKDYKTILQEIVQKNREETLSYLLVGEEGPDHDKRFTVEVYLNSNPFARGTGRSKKEAEQQAARAALEMMGQ